MNAASPFAGASWIWPDNPHWDLFNGYALFRAAFVLKRVPVRAPFFITADQSYRLFVNGSFVARGPARGRQDAWPYDEIDLRPWLAKGTNVIAVRAYNPGHGTFQYISQGFAGLLAAARWGKVRIATGEQWKCVRQSNVRRHTAPRSIQLLNAQEQVDLRSPLHGWQEPGFDDSGWGRPAARRWDSAPWTALCPRGIPLLKEETWDFAPLIGIGGGCCAAGYADPHDVVALRLREPRGHRPAVSLPMPLEIPATRRGRFRSYLFDFGRTVVGNLWVIVESGQEGAIVDTHYGETIDAETLALDQHAVSHSRLALGERLVLRDGRNEHAFFHHNGFRYVAVTVRDSTRALELTAKLQWTGYPLRRRGRFSSSDARLEKIWEACAWTQQCCSLDAYVDTPWREQAQWWGDARVQAWNTFHLDGDARLLRRGIAQIAAQSTGDGLTYGHAPTIAHNCVLPDFTLIWLITLWDFYWQTGSTAPLRENAAAVDRALAYFRNRGDPATGFVAGDERYWLFLDWTGLPKDGVSSVYNLWLLIALEKLIALHRIDGQGRRAAALVPWARRLRRGLAGLVGADGLICDGVDRKGRRYRGKSIHAQTLAAAAGLGGLSVDAALHRVVLPWIRGEAAPEAVPSAYWVTYVFDLLAAEGRAGDALDFVRSRWGPMAAHGTTWENYAPRRGEESHSHAWSAHPLFHLMRMVGGISQTAPAWKAVRFAPYFDGDFGETTIPTPQGDIVSRWDRRPDSSIRVSLRLPKGVSAEVRLPGRRVENARGTRRWLLRPTG